MHQCVQVDARQIAHNDEGTGRSIEHPTWHADPQFRIVGILITMFNTHQHRGLAAIASPSQNDHVVIEKWVKTINDLRGSELAGSVWIR